MTTILEVSAQRFLSLEKIALELGRLNVLVGPNGAGKSNILQIFQFLGDVARNDLVPAVQRLGGYKNVRFRGSDSGHGYVNIKFKGIISEHASPNAPDVYSLSFRKSPKSPAYFISEEITIKRTRGRGRRISISGGSVKFETERRKLSSQPDLNISKEATGLATLRRLGERYEAAGVEAIAQVFEQLRLFEIDVEKVRRPSVLSEDAHLRTNAENLASYLYSLKLKYPDVLENICGDMRHVLPGFRELKFVPIGGADEAVRVDIVERQLDGATPLARVSFGTIRALGLFTMLNDPDPPSLTCIEEVDHGLHPHALDLLVDRVREASGKTQIILATHSPALVNRLDPSELIVVERNEETGGTTITQPKPALIRQLKRETGYELGELWFSGIIGGSPR